MRFSILKTATAALAFISGAQAAIKHDELVDKIKSLTDQTHDLVKPAKALTLADIPLFATGQGPLAELVGGFIKIASTAADVTTELSGSAKIGTDAGIDAVAAALKGLTKASETVFDTLTDKLELFSNIPIFGQAIAAVIGAAQKVVGELADGILSLVEGNSEKLKEATGGLNSAFKGIVGDFADLVGA